MRTFLKSWGPVILWAALIAFFSTDQFSATNTSRVIVPLVLWIFPNASFDFQETIHHFFRKFGHWSEYFILSLLIMRAFRGATRKEWQKSWAWWTLALVLAYALSDELHQLFVPSRTASLVDSMIDFLGGICAVFWIFFRHARTSEGWRKKDEP
jgi:VanZ family protein